MASCRRGNAAPRFQLSQFLNAPASVASRPPTGSYATDSSRWPSSISQGARRWPLWTWIHFKMCTSSSRLFVQPTWAARHPSTYLSHYSRRELTGGHVLFAGIFGTLASISRLSSFQRAATRHGDRPRTRSPPWIRRKTVHFRRGICSFLRPLGIQAPTAANNTWRYRGSLCLKKVACRPTPTPQKRRRVGQSRRNFFAIFPGETDGAQISRRIPKRMVCRSCPCNVA